MAVSLTRWKALSAPNAVSSSFTCSSVTWWEGGWVGYGKVEEEQAVGMGYWGLEGGGWVGR